MARPRFKVTAESRNAVEKMAAIGVSEDTIAKMIGEWGIDPKTLRKHYSKELKRGAAKGEVGLKQKRYEIAMNGNVAMLKHLSENMELRQNRGYQPNGIGSPVKPDDVRAKLALLFRKRSEASKAPQDPMTIDSAGPESQADTIVAGSTRSA